MIVASEDVSSHRPRAVQPTTFMPCVAAFMFLVPLVTGFCVSRLVAEPAFEFMQHRSPLAFAPSDRQKASMTLSVERGKLILWAILH